MPRLLVVVLCMLASFACVQLPRRPMEAGSRSTDGSVAAELAVDASLRRPATGAPYVGPEATVQTHPRSDGSIAIPSGLDGGPARGAPSVAASSNQGVTSAVAPRPRKPKRPSAGGQIVITEIMSNPQVVSDENGEWFELHNPSPSDAFDLAGCAIDDGGRTLHAIAAAFVLEAGAFATIARSINAGFGADLVLAISLSNGADAVALNCDGTEIDRVAYGPGFPLSPGASMSLDPEATDAVANDVASAWCLAQPAYGSGPDRGTPGAPNPDCAGADAGAD